MTSFWTNIWSTVCPEEFEAMWNALLEKYSLNNGWLNPLWIIWVRQVPTYHITFDQAHQAPNGVKEWMLWWRYIFQDITPYPSLSFFMACFFQDKEWDSSISHDIEEKTNFDDLMAIEDQMSPAYITYVFYKFQGEIYNAKCLYDCREARERRYITPRSHRTETLRRRIYA